MSDSENIKQDLEIQQVSPAQHNMSILEFLFKNKTDFWNKNEVSDKAGQTSKKWSKVSEVLEFFHGKKLVTKFSELSDKEQKEIRRRNIKRITSESFQITEKGEKIYKRIVLSCLEPMAKELLSLR